MISTYGSLSSFMRRLNTIKKKHPEIPVVSISKGQLNSLSLGYVDFSTNLQDENKILTPKEYETLDNKNNYTLSIILGDYKNESPSL